jgi:hypothetical protein
VTRYSIIRAPGFPELQDKVQRAIDVGWEPIGGVAVGIGPNMCMEAAQALVLREMPSGRNA